jgi:hypothetical protein
MKLTWDIRYGDYVGFLAEEPEIILAHIVVDHGYWLGSSFAGVEEETCEQPSLEWAQIRAQELMDEWVQRHTLGGKHGDTLLRSREANREQPTKEGAEA